MEPAIPFAVAYPHLRGWKQPGGKLREQCNPDESRRANRERRSITASNRAVGVLGSDGMADICEPLINAVNCNRLKLLISLNQKGAQLANPLKNWVTRT